MNAFASERTRGRTVYHGIDREKDNDSTEILEAQYGDSWHTNGTVNMRPADFLYVVRSTKTGSISPHACPRSRRCTDKRFTFW